MAIHGCMRSLLVHPTVALWPHISWLAAQPAETEELQLY